MGLRLRLVSVVTGGSPSATSPPSVFSAAAPPLTLLLLLLSALLTGEAYVVRWNNSAINLQKQLPSLLGSVDGYSLAAAKDGSKIIATTDAPPVAAEGHLSAQDSEGGRGGHGVQHHGHGHVSEAQQHLKHHHQHQEGAHIPMPDFERQLAQLKEDPGSSVNSGQQHSRSVHDEDVPIEPQSRKDGNRKRVRLS